MTVEHSVNHKFIILHDYQGGRIPSLSVASLKRWSKFGLVARRRVWKALEKVGGLSSPVGSILWHVAGSEESVKSWAAAQTLAGRRISEETASGVLIAGLGVLAAHYGIAAA